jgi:VacB/RNase II family 3'-5' exoribonuclease
VRTFPMLPDELSTDRTSLVNAQDRAGLVIELRIANAGDVVCHDVFCALLHNRAKLAYNSVGAWLEGRGPIPPAIASVPGMEAQLRLQQELAVKLKTIRRQYGALNFESSEPRPVLENGEVTGLVVNEQNAAEDIIENFMVAANVAMAKHLKERKSLSIRRVVKVPKRWDRIQALAAEYGTKLPATPDPRALSDFLDQRRAADPEHFQDLSLSIVKLLGPGQYIVEHPGEEHTGHFGLAANDYTHSTAPNRRYSDLVMQRLLKATIAGAPCPYSEKDLSDIAMRCTEREDAAKKVERLMRKVIAASLLGKRIGETFEGIIKGASAKGTFVRLLKFPAEGMVVRGGQGVDVGDKVQVKLCSVDVNRGFVDFERK